MVGMWLMVWVDVMLCRALCLTALRVWMGVIVACVIGAVAIMRLVMVHARIVTPLLTISWTLQPMHASYAQLYNA